MSFKYKKNVIELLKKKGYTTYRIAKEGVINQSAMQKIRDGKMIAWGQLEKICSILGCQLSDIIEHINDDKEQKQ